MTSIQADSTPVDTPAAASAVGTSTGVGPGWSTPVAVPNDGGSIRSDDDARRRRVDTLEAKPTGSIIVSRIRNLFAAPERRRLIASIDIAKFEIESHSEGALRDALAVVLRRSRAEAIAGDLDAGWRFLHQARRELVSCIDLEELSAWRTALRHEAQEKLKGWRNGAALALLGTEDEKQSDEKVRAATRNAMRVFDEHSDNVYFRNRLTRTQMAVLGFVLATLICSFLLLLHLRPSVGTALQGTAMPASVFLAAMILGGMGACLSGLVTFATASTEVRIPTHVANVMVTATRPLIGAASGAVGLLVLKSGLLAASHNAALWIVPFAFGFTERAVIGALERAGKL